MLLFIERAQHPQVLPTIITVIVIIHKTRAKSYPALKLKHDKNLMSCPRSGMANSRPSMESFGARDINRIFTKKKNIFEPKVKISFH